MYIHASPVLTGSRSWRYPAINQNLRVTTLPNHKAIRRSSSLVPFVIAMMQCMKSPTMYPMIQTLLHIMKSKLESENKDTVGSLQPQSMKLQ